MSIYFRKKRRIKQDLNRLRLLKRKSKLKVMYRRAAEGRGLGFVTPVKRQEKKIKI